jgi:hypothetical protein
MMTREDVFGPPPFEASIRRAPAGVLANADDASDPGEA